MIKKFPNLYKSLTNKKMKKFNLKSKKLLTTALFITSGLTIFSYSNPMQRICHAVSVKYPEMKFIGLCHAIAEMERDLPVLDLDYSKLI